MEAARPGGLDEGHQAKLLQHRPGGAGGALDLVEILVRGIEIDHQPVGVIDPVGARQPDVQGEAGLVGEVGERGRIFGQDVLDLAALLGEARPVDPGREVVRRVLLHEARALDAVGIALERQRTAGQMGQHDGRDAPVVADQIALGQANLREQDLGGVRELDLVAVDLDHLLLASAHCSGLRPSRPTSLAGLSRRRPRNRGWRSRPSDVHSVKPISATSFGWTKVTDGSRTVSVKGEPPRTRPSSRLRRSTSVRSSKPVPTLPA